MKKFTVCIVGAGSRYTPDMIAMLAYEKDRFPIKKLVFYDNNSEIQNLIANYVRVLLKEYYPEIEEFVVTTNPEEAFQDIDFALMQIRAGRLPMREKDEKISLKYGCIGQETCGAGGFAYGMRSVPAIIDIIKNIRKYSPKAWILNYSNPAAIVAEATKRVFKDDYRVINICDMPIAIMDIYAKVLNMSRKDFEPRYFGLNHFGWFTKIIDKKTGEDYLPKLRAYFQKNNADSDDGEMLDASWAHTYEFMSTMIRDFDDYLPNTYMQYYLYPRKKVAESNPEYTRANECMDGSEKKVHEMCEAVAKLGKIKGTKYELEDHCGVHASYIVDLAMALAYNTNEIFLIITENKGAISNVDSGMMVEVPCRVGANGPEPLAVGEILTFHKGLMENQYAYEKLTVDACLEGSYQKALQALVLNRTVSDTPTAKALLEEFIEANREYWPELK